ncbi:MAG: serine/threonine protein kinase [Ktedonobacteraceae bacterium]
MSTSLRRLGKYELRKLLGSGSAGEVWQGYDLQARRDVAVKLLHPDLLQSDPNFISLFMKNWQPIISLHHPNIVKVHEVNISRPGDTNGTTPYIVMDYVEGQLTLADSIQRTSRSGNFPSVSDIVYLFNSLGQALDYAHEQNVVHGDIKPTNILLDLHNTVDIAGTEARLTDFGIANLPGNKNRALSNYLSPEQVKGKNPDAYSDIYALGIILYEMCTGVLPFHADSQVAVMMHHVNTLPTPPILINPHIPPALSEVILRAIAKEPQTRFASALALAMAIGEACAGGQSSQAVLEIKQLTLGETQAYPHSGPLRPPSSQAPLTGKMTSILGVSGPLLSISAPHSAMRADTTSARITGHLQQNSFQSGPLAVPAVDGRRSSTPLPLPQTPTQVTGQFPTPSMQQTSTHQAAPLVAADTMKFRSSNALSPMVLMIGLLCLLLVVVGALGVSLFLTNGSQHAPALSANSAIGHVFFQDDALGHDDTLRIQLQNVPSPPQGKRYFAWLQNTGGQAVPLGPLSIQNGTTRLTYLGDGKHTNLLSIVRGVFVTLENDKQTTPQTPSIDAKVYQSSFASASFPYIQHILYMLPGFPDHGSLIAGLFGYIGGINDKAGSVVDSLRSTHDYGLALRQANRIMEMIDGSENARASGDLPPALPLLLSAPVGLLSSSSQMGYIDTLAGQIDKVIQTTGDNADLHQHAQNVRNALIDLRDWIQKMHDYDEQILKASNLGSANVLSVALQLKQLAVDSYTGRTIPPNPGPLPILGSAGIYQASVECQYLATLDIKKIA